MSRVYLGETGDGRVAVFESATKEPLQYVTSEKGATKLVESWEERMEYWERKGKA